MSTPRLPNQKTQYKKLNERLSKYMASVLSIYESVSKEAAGIALTTDYDGESEFSFKDYPITRDRIQKLQQQFVSDLGGLIYAGTSDEWKRSNLLQDMIADKVLGKYVGEHKGKKYEHYYQKNSGALKAFQQRKDRGLNLSDKLWNQSKDLKTSLEETLSVSIEKGIDAVTLSKRVSKYLWDFPSMQAAYEEKFGHASKAKDCEYRSIRLARSEINMAYRTAEQERWRQFDFVVGYEIKLSGSHPAEDVCDRLAGKYPKDFVWSGWHPNDLCYVVPILKTEEEYFADDDIKSKNEVTDVPREFKDWCTENWNRISKAEKRGTLPYFLRDNKEYYQKELSVKKAAVLRHKNRDAKAIQAAWDNRNALQDRYGKAIGNLRRNSRYWGTDISEIEEYLQGAKISVDEYGFDEKLDELMLKAVGENNRVRAEANARFARLKTLRDDLSMSYGDYRHDDIISEIDSFLAKHKPNANEMVYGASYEPTKSKEIRDELSNLQRKVQKRTDVLHTQNVAMLESKLETYKMVPMSFDEADHLLPNPMFSTEERPYRVNCQSCVVAYELRRRGFDVEALPNFEIDGSPQMSLASNTSIIWIDRKTGRTPIAEYVSLSGLSGESALSAVEDKIKVKGRYHISVVWKQTDADGKLLGHVFTIERKRNGTIFAYDPQDGSHPDNFLKNQLENVSRSYRVKIYRVDNCDVNTQYIDKIVKKK